MFDLMDFEAKNFTAFFVGMKTDYVHMNLRGYFQRLFVLKAGNGKGKTAMLANIHPLPHSTDGRKKIIRKGKNGYKKLVYENTIGEQLICKIVYTSSKKGHNTKAYLTKIDVQGNEEDLNPNGNVGSYLTMIGLIMGIDKDYLNLTSHSDSSSNIVDMTSSQRRGMALNIIKGLDEYVPYQKVINGKFKNTKTILSSLVDKIGKLHDEDAIEEMLTFLDKELEFYGNERDNFIGIKAKSESVLRSFPQGTNIKLLSQKRTDLINENNQLLNRKTELERIFNGVQYTEEKLTSHINSLTSGKIDIINSLDHTLKMYENYIFDLTEVQDNIVKLETKMNANSLNNISSINQYIDELNDMKSEYNEKYKGINLSLTKDDILRIISVQTQIYDSIESVFGYDRANVNSALSYIGEYGIDEALDIISNNDVKAFENMSSLDNMIEVKSMELTNLQNEVEHKTAVLQLRPKSCKDDSCALIKDALSAKQMESNFSDMERNIANLYSNINRYSEERNAIQEQYSIVKSMHGFYMLIDSIKDINDRLPEKFQLTKAGLFKAFKSEDFFYLSKNYQLIINVIDKKSEFESIEAKILEMEQRKIFIQENSDLFDNIEEKMHRLKSLESDILEKVAKVSKEKDEKNSKVIEIDTQIAKISKLKEYAIEYTDVIDNLMDIESEYIKANENLNIYNENYREYMGAVEELKIVESKLKGLSAEKLMYKHEEIKLKEYQAEYKILDDDLSIITILKDAVAPKGMPTVLIDFYMEDVRQIANTLLANTFDGGLFLEEFKIDDDEFKIPYRKYGEEGEDISSASTSERAFIRLAISLALYEVYGSDNYGIILLDEVDGGLDDENKDIFVNNILLKQVERVGMTKIMVITHNYPVYKNVDHVKVHFKAGTNDEENIYLLSA